MILLSVTQCIKKIQIENHSFMGRRDNEKSFQTLETPFLLLSLFYLQDMHYFFVFRYQNISISVFCKVGYPPISNPLPLIYVRETTYLLIKGVLVLFILQNSSMGIRVTYGNRIKCIAK